ncbi:hypothetical protein MK527_11470, partial [Streptococcus gallolyticus subsp. gallolyticus]|nr:hypothetical protein [Streptococcus gallolyticus subsp. gallolyticus]
QDDIKWYDAT